MINIIYKDYGKTGKKISAIAFGGMRFNSDDYKNGRIEKCVEVAVRANEMGINYFDTAPGYCDDKSEEIMGLAFSEMKKPFYSSTKCGLWNANNESEARARLEKSLKILGLNKITFYNMWCVKTFAEYEEFTKKGGIYEGLLKAKEEGLIEHICFSTHAGSMDIEKIVKEGLVEGVTLNYNAMNFSYRQNGVRACHEAGLGVVTMNPLGGGIIPRHKDYFSFLSEGTNDSVNVAAIKFIISQKEITAALCGISSLSDLEEDLKATENLTAITDEEFARLKTNLHSGLNSLCTGCSYCDECPVDIQIPKLLDSYNEYILSGNLNDVNGRLKNFWGITNEGAKKCIECGKCERLCTQKLPIIERLKEIAGV